MKRYTIIGLISLLTGCGGGASNSNNEVPIPSEPPQLIIEGPSTVTLGDSVDFAVLADTGESITSIRWNSASPEISSLSAHTQVFAFDASSSGDFTVSVTAVLASGVSVEAEKSFSIVEDTTPNAIIRRGHEASEGNRVSLRVYPNPLKADDVTSITWSQQSGPNAVNVSYSNSLSYSIYFEAPRVTQDQIIEYQADITYSDGTQGTDTAQILVKSTDIDTSGFMYALNNDGTETVTTHMQPYIENSPYASALAQCVYNNTVKNSCPFSTLPLLGQDTETPTIDDVLDRTYVSHPWMGDAFKEYLMTSPSGDDMLSLLRATTAVVISYDIRPSFYWTATGAIYLDANNFWRTPEERDTVNTRPDYRSGFGAELAYDTTWRYVKDGAYYYPQPGTQVENRATRTRAGVEAALTWLMYHELAHANDFFDYTRWSQISMSESPLSYTRNNGYEPLSTGLDRVFPLTSSQLHALARVMYRGESASSAQRGYSAQQIAQWFTQDGAVSFYSYHTEREDFATLIERFMMLYRMGVSADAAVFTQQTISDGEYNVTWAQRDRVNHTGVQPRVNYAVSRVLPELNVPLIQSTLPAPQDFPVGAPWFDTLTLSGQPSPIAPANLSQAQKAALLEQVKIHHE